MYSNAAISSKVENLIFESKRSHLEIILSSTPLASSHILTPFMNKDSLILYGVQSYILGMSACRYPYTTAAALCTHLVKLRESRKVAEGEGARERGGRQATATTEGKLTSREQIASSMPATTCLFKLEFSHNGLVEVLLSEWVGKSMLF